jgi:hypothetical protein
MCVVIETCRKYPRGPTRITGTDVPITTPIVFALNNFYIYDRAF